MSNLTNWKSIFTDMVDQFGLLQTREIMSAWSGLKVARIGLKTKKLPYLKESLAKLNLHCQIVTEPVFIRRDVGKGGWSNKFEDREWVTRKNGDYLVYISNDIKSLQKAFRSELEGEEEEFGEKLGIPACCIDFYSKNLDLAYEKQNDFVPLVLKNTKELHSFNFWNNYVAQYFGYSLLSFFPCSFNCEHSATFAQNTFDLINSILPLEASQIIHYQKQPILYTEYRGIYLFEGANCCEDTVYLEDSILHATVKSNSKSLEKILNLNSITIKSKSKLSFVDNIGSKTIVNNENIAFCTFK